MKKLREVETPLANFFASGVLCLREKLGPILWQFPPNFGWNKDRFSDFFELLPRDTAAAAKLARRHNDKLKGGAWTKTDARQSSAALCGRDSASDFHGAGILCAPSRANGHMRKISPPISFTAVCTARRNFTSAVTVQPRSIGGPREFENGTRESNRVTRRSFPIELPAPETATFTSTSITTRKCTRPSMPNRSVRTSGARRHHPDARRCHTPQGGGFQPPRAARNRPVRKAPLLATEPPRQ